MFTIGLSKAPGPDGFHVFFFQQMWHIVGGRVTSSCPKVLNKEEFVSSLNATNIVMIPKLKNLVKVGDFKPISLCNVLYKVILKALARVPIGNGMLSLLPEN